MKKSNVIVLISILFLSLTALGLSVYNYLHVNNTDNLSTDEKEEETNNIKDEPVIDGDFIYTNNDKTEIIGLSEDGCKAIDLVFPENVTKISNIYFDSTSLLQRVYFNNIYVEVEDISFANTNIISISNLPDTMTDIPNNFFSNCTRLTTIGDIDNTIALPKHIKSIGSGAFSGCSSITTIDLNNVTVVSDYAFQGCKSLETITWDKVETIGNGAFFGTGFIEINLPDTTNEIGGLSFFRCTNLTTVNINNVTTVGERAFDDCELITDFTANKDFTVIHPISKEESFENLFDPCARVTLHIPDNFAYSKYLDKNPNNNYMVE